jgi:hypothetical protein
MSSTPRARRFLVAPLCIRFSASGGALGEKPRAFLTQEPQQASPAQFERTRTHMTSQRMHHEV